MRILHVINALGGGGRERRMSQVVASLCKTPGYIQSIITLNNNRSYQVFDALGVSINTVKGNRFCRIKQYRTILKEFNPHIVHLWLDTPSELMFFSSVKCLFHYKLVAGFVADANAVRGISTYSLGVRFAFRMADSIVSNSKAGLIAKEAPICKSTIIYNGFDFNRFNLLLDSLDKRNAIGVGLSKIVAMSASMKPTKDWMSFLDSAKECNKRGMDVIFIAIGGGELLDPLKKYAISNKIDNVIFLGYRDDVEELLLASDYFMLFTNNENHAEGVSNSILEAMAAGLPVIATRGGGTSEIIQDGINGFIIEPKDVVKGVDLLSLLIKDECLSQSIGFEAKKTIELKFSIDRQNSEYTTLYNKLLS